METMKQSGPWSSLGSDGSLVPVVLCGGYVFPAARLNEILTFKVRFDLDITGINPEAILIMGDHYGHLLCPGLQPGPPSQTPGGLGQR